MSTMQSSTWEKEDKEPGTGRVIGRYEPETGLSLQEPRLHSKSGEKTDGGPQGQLPVWVTQTFISGEYIPIFNYIIT